MKILFIYPNITGHENISMGIASLSSYLKREGHEVDLMDFTWGQAISECVDRVRRSKPDVIGFSTTSGEFNFSLKVADELKKNFDIPIIFGGVHPTVAPEQTIMQKSVDMICRGEGELALAELLYKMEKNEEISHISNFWFKDGSGRIIKNSVRPLIMALDSLPFPDMELFDCERYLKATSGEIDLMSGRGCPFVCSYCINQMMQNTYGLKGRKFLRRNSVDYVLQMLSSLNKRYNIQHIKFQDDLFTMDKDWLREFSEKYPRDFNIPFSCNARVETMNEEVAGLLKKANCVSVSMGIESGSERIRKGVLKRLMSNEAIVKAFKCAKDAGLNTVSYNMVGIPYEKKEDMERTVWLNQIVKPDFLGISIFLPYPGTPLYDMCRERGWIDENFEILPTHRLKSLLNYPDVSAEEIRSWKRWFRFRVLKKSSLKKAVIVLLFDLGYDLFYRLRRKLPSVIKNSMFRVNRWLRYSTSNK